MIDNGRCALIVYVCVKVLPEALIHSANSIPPLVSAEQLLEIQK